MPEEGVKLGSSWERCNARAKKIQRCHPLEPVLEHSVTCLNEAPRKQPQQSSNEGTKQSKGKAVLTRLRDGYVNLMNGMASSADLTGVSACMVSPQGKCITLVQPPQPFREKPTRRQRWLAASPSHRRN